MNQQGQEDLKIAIFIAKLLWNNRYDETNYVHNYVKHWAKTSPRWLVVGNLIGIIGLNDSNTMDTS